jgi:hypothetical protein
LLPVSIEDGLYEIASSSGNLSRRVLMSSISTGL